ncbi:MAG: restriction endonuclease subunit S, partial [Oscillospiraceae bacterium]
GIALEKEKILYFLLTYEQNIVLVKAGQKQKEKNFLGYEFSERRGHEGIKHLPGGTKLFDENGELLNPKKVNYYIYNAFLGNVVSIDESLAQNVSYGRMSGFINYGTNKFDKAVNLNRKFQFETKCPLYTLASMSMMIKRGKSASYGNSDIQIIKSGQARGFLEFDFTERHFVSDTFVSDERNLMRGDILINSTGVGTAGRVTLFDIEGSYVADSHITIVRLNSEYALPRYVLYALAHIGFKNIEAMANGQSGQIELTLETISDIKIPLPPLEIQRKIVAEISEVELKESRSIEQINELKSSIYSIIKSISTEKHQERLGVVAQYSNDRISSVNLSDDTYVGVDNLLQNMEGKVFSQFVPDSGTATAYSSGDILLSNIRPYLKKIWLADNDGGSSGDVLVLKVDNTKIHSDYLYYLLATDEFFEYEMQHIKGVKMPRADKTSVLNYVVSIPSLNEQRKIIGEIKKIEIEIKAMQAGLAELKLEKDSVLQKYL